MSLRSVAIRLWVLTAFVLSASVAAAGSLRDFEGAVRSLDDYIGHGKWTVVMLWASDCQVCNAEAYQYIDFHMAHRDDDAVVVGISLDGAAKMAAAQEFIDRHGVDFPNLIGEAEDVAALYTSQTGRPWVGTPTFLVFNPAGELRAQQVGAVPPNLIEDFIRRESAATRPTTAEQD